MCACDQSYRKMRRGWDDTVRVTVVFDVFVVYWAVNARRAAVK